MKRMVKILSALVASFLVLTTLLSGCGSSESSSGSTPSTTAAGTSADKIDTSEPVDLKMWLIGDAQPDAQKVFDEINKLSQKDINAKISVQYTTWTDWQNKYNLLFASGENFDLASCYSWSDYVGLATKNAFKEITKDDLNKYCPDIVKAVPASYLDDATINGKIFMVPNNNLNAQGGVIAIRGDLREKYKLNVKTPADYANYLKTIAKNEKGITAFNGDVNKGIFELFFQPSGYSYPVTNFNNSVVYKKADKTGRLLKIIDTPEFKDSVQKVRELYDAGAINKDILSSKVIAADNFVAGKSASMADALDSTQGKVDQIIATHPEWKPEIINLNTAYAPDLILHQDGMVIPAASKNAERALMWTNLVATNKAYQFLALYGIQGTHYNLTDGKYQALPGNKNYSFEGNVPWGYWNDSLRLRDTTKSDWYYDTYDKWHKAAFVDPNPVAKISFDDTKIKTEEAAVNNVASTFLKGLMSGGLDPAKNLESIAKKYTDAGIDKCITELQAQVDKKLKK